MFADIEVVHVGSGGWAGPISPLSHHDLLSNFVRGCLVTCEVVNVHD